MCFKMELVEQNILKKKHTKAKVKSVLCNIIFVPIFVNGIWILKQINTFGVFRPWIRMVNLYLRYKNFQENYFVHIKINLCIILSKY